MSAPGCGPSPRSPPVGSTMSTSTRSACSRSGSASCNARVVPLEVAVDLEGWGQGVDEVTPDRHLTARDELRRLQAGLAQLPARCREVVVLRKIQGFSQREVAARMGIREDTVERQTAHGMRALADFMLGGSGRIRRGAAGHRKAAP